MMAPLFRALWGWGWFLFGSAVSGAVVKVFGIKGLPWLSTWSSPHGGDRGWNGRVYLQGQCRVRDGPEGGPVER